MTNLKNKSSETKMAEISFICPICNRTHSIYLNEDQLRRYDEWELNDCDDLVQDVFPELPASDREKFITGICDICQKKIFGSEEPEE